MREDAPTESLTFGSYIGQTFYVEIGASVSDYYVTGYAYSFNSNSASAIYEGPLTFSFVLQGDITINIWTYRQFKLSYNTLHGTGSMSDQVAWGNNTFTVKDCSFTWENHEFVEWRKGGTDLTYTPGDKIEITGDTILWAEWKSTVVYYTYTYYSNPPVSGVSEQSVSYEYEEGSTVSSISCPWSFSSYYWYFSSWSGFSSNVTGNRSINATWYYSPPVTTYYITYHANYPDGSDETSSQSVNSNSSCSIRSASECGFTTPAGYTWSHWNTNSSGTGSDKYENNTYYGSSGNESLYAVWEPIIVTVNLNKNGGSGGTSTIYMKYDSGWYSSSSCTSSSKITSLPSTPEKIGYDFKGYNTSSSGSGTLAVSETGAINVSDTFYSTDGTRTWYAVWEAKNPAYYDSEGGYWYVENGKLPQSKVSDSLKSTLSGRWSSLDSGTIYFMGVEELADGDLTEDGGMRSRVYNGNEYVNFNGEYYLVEPIRWRLVYSSSQKEGYAVENTSVLATMAEIVFLGSYSSTKIGVGAGYSAESVTMLLKNQVSVDYLVNEDKSVNIFGTTTLKDTTTVSGSVFVASCEELANFTTNKNNTTGSGVKAGKVSLSDFVKDYLRATGQGDYYFTRDLGDQLNSIFCFNPVGNRTQIKAQQVLGIQFTVKITEYAM